MVKIKFLLLFLLLFTFALSALTVEEIHQKLLSSHQNLKSWQANLSQTNYYAQIKQSSSFEGKIYYQPQKLLIRFEKPYLQRLMISNNSVQLYDAQSSTLLKSTLMPEFERMNPLEILQHYWTKSRVSIVKTDKNRSSISLIPIKDSFMKSLNATIDNKNGTLYELSYRDFSDNTVSYKFSNIKANASIPSSVWEWKLPKDTQIIER